MATINLAAAQTCAAEMLAAGGQDNHVTPNIRLALCAAILSSNNRLDRNGKQAHALRQYMGAHGGKLPTDIETVKRLCIQAGFECTHNQARGVVEVEQHAVAGELAELAIMPRTAQAWLLWRATVRQFFGMGWKTSSFAAMLMWPLACPFAVVDRHVVARLAWAGKLCRFGVAPDVLYKRLSGSTNGAYKVYRQLERLVAAEKRSAQAGCSTGVWHWAAWSAWRQFVGVEAPSERLESHELLSPYWY
jgi:hypothetical protein